MTGRISNVPTAGTNDPISNDDDAAKQFDFTNAGKNIITLITFLLFVLFSTS